MIIESYVNIPNVFVVAGVISALLQLPTLCPHVESVKLQMLSFTPQQYHSFISSLTNLKVWIPSWLFCITITFLKHKQLLQMVVGLLICWFIHWNFDFFSKRFQFRECSKYMNPENGVSELLNPLTSYCTKLIDFDMSFDFFHCNKQNIGTKWNNTSSMFWFFNTIFISLSLILTKRHLDAIEEFGKVIGTQLQRLNLSFSYTRWDGNLIAYLLPYCTNLIELDVGYCMDFT